MYMYNRVCFCYMQVYVGLEYHAEPADIWSCGIVLVAMLAGGVYMYILPHAICVCVGYRFCSWYEQFADTYMYKHNYTSIHAVF